MTRTDLVTTVAVTRHESGCGHSMRVWFTVEFKYADGRKSIKVKNARSGYVLDALRTFGADTYQASQTARRGGTLYRDPETLAVTPSERTAVNWAKWPLGTFDKF